MTLTESACGMDINCRPAEQLKGVTARDGLMGAVYEYFVACWSDLFMQWGRRNLVAIMRLKRGCEPNMGIDK
jgi:hypothetical protein